MQRYRSFVSLIALFTVGGCEDGPTQVYSPSPAGAGSVWNNGQTPATVDTAAKKAFTIDNSGTNKQEICTGAQKATRWGAMVQEPIIPPRKGAGIDLAGSDLWPGLTIEQAEKINCQSDNLGDAYGDGTQTNSWGDNQEVLVEYLVSNRQIFHMAFFPGYTGKMEFKSPDGSHSYSIQLNTPIQKDGKTFSLNWLDAKTFAAEVDELYRAIMATYAPALPVEPDGQTCFDNGQCTQGSFGDVGYFGIQPLGWYLSVNSRVAAQPTPSIPTNIDQYKTKVMAFAYAAPLLKMDQEGPTASAGNLGKRTTPCVLKLGQTYQDFVHQCVQVTDDAMADQVELSKLLGGITHGTERFYFDVQGVDMDFTDNALPANDVVHDADRPHATDISTRFTVDQSALGVIANDYDSSGNLDLHGSGAVYKEYARLVRANLLALSGVADGPIKNCLFPNPVPSNFDPQSFINNLPPYCTGFEGLITAAPPTKAHDPVNLGPDNAQALDPDYSLGLKPGHPQILICMDPTGDLSTGYNFCGAPWGAQGDIFSTSYAQALRIFGKGKTANMPTDVQDVRFFFKMYVTAMLKYFQVADQNPVPDISGLTLVNDNLFFDSQGAGQFEIAEYVDRRFVSATQDPMDVLIEADVKNGIFDAYEFSRDLYRGESALYQAVLEDPNGHLGQQTGDDALLTNLFGSPVIKAGWHASKKSGKSAYYCATNMDPANCDNQTPPLDADGNVLLDDQGRPMLTPYRGAFAGSNSVFQLGETKIKVTNTFDNIQSAMIQIPLHQDPYDVTSAVLPSLTVLVPWAPKQPGIGFPVALSGTLDKFIQTSQLDMSGTTITANVDYDVVIDTSTGLPKKDGAIQFLAVETTDFLGDVFLCQDASTGDLLTARMYTPVANILNWIQAHPNSYTDCQIIIRYSPFNNYADYITSLSAGVRLGITQGGGFGRVVDATLFVPGQ